MMYSVVKTSASCWTEVDWDCIPEINLSSNDGCSIVEHKSCCKMCYNSDGILFKFLVHDDKINCTMSGYNQPIYDEETVELFFQPTEDPHNYIELEWNGIGGVFAANIFNDLNSKTDISFISENVIKSDIFADDEGWSVFGFIPKSIFAADLSGEWKFNAYRIKRRQDNSMILYAFSPTIEPAFHKPNKFATLKFL